MTISVTPKGASTIDGNFVGASPWTITGAALGTGDIVVFVATDAISPSVTGVIVDGVTATPLGTSSSGLGYAFIAQGITNATGNIQVTFNFGYNLLSANWFLITGENPSPTFVSTSYTATNTPNPIAQSVTVASGGAALVAFMNTVLSSNSNPTTWTNCDTSGNTTLESYTGTGNQILIAGNYSTTPGSYSITGSDAAGVNGEIMALQFAASGAASPSWGFDPPQIPLVARMPRARLAALQQPSNIEVPLTRFYPAGFEVQSVQPPNPITTNVARNNRRSAAFYGGHNPGNQLPQIAFRPFGFEVQSVQPPNPLLTNLGRNNKRFAATVGGIENIEGVYSFVPLVLPAWHGNPDGFQPRVRARRDVGFIESIEGVAPALAPVTSGWGFDAQPFQPPRPSMRQRYAGLRGRSQFAVLPQFYPFGFEPTPPMLRRPSTVSQRGVVAGGDSQFAYSDMPPWQDLVWQPVYRRRPLTDRLVNVESVLTAPVVVTSAWGFEQPPLTLRRLYRRDVGYIESIEGPSVPFVPFGWPVQPFQPPHPAREKRFGAIAPISNIEGEYVFVPPGVVTSGWGFDQFPLTLRRYWRRDVGFIESIEGPAPPPFVPFGWGAQDFQPPHPAREKRFGALAPSSIIEGTMPPPVLVPLAFWETNYPQPPHPRWQRAGAIMPSSNIEAQFVFVPPAAPTMWEGYYPQPPHPRPERSAAIMPASNIEVPLGRFLPFGWYVPPPHPEPHPRREKFGAIAPPIGLIETPFTAFYPTAWDVYPQPPHPRPERGAAILPAAFNFPFVQFFVRLHSNYIARSPRHRYVAISEWIKKVAQANELVPPIDAAVAVRTVTFDFGVELEAGVTITNVVSISCVVYQSASDTVTDPTPGDRIIGSYQLATSPNSEQPNQAVSQLFGNMVGGVTYRLMCVVQTSDGQQPSCWAHLSCQNPN